jgi:hypothetical protein
MPRKKIYTSFDMSDRQLKNWKNRVDKGAALEINGAFRDSVFVPQTASDIDPDTSIKKNQLRLERMRRIIKNTKEYGSNTYIA